MLWQVHGSFVIGGIGALISLEGVAILKRFRVDDPVSMFYVKYFSAEYYENPTIEPSVVLIYFEVLSNQEYCRVKMTEKVDT